VKEICCGDYAETIRAALKRDERVGREKRKTSNLVRMGTNCFLTDSRKRLKEIHANDGINWDDYECSSKGAGAGEKKGNIS